MTRSTLSSDITLRLKIHDIEIEDNSFGEDLLVTIETDALSDDPAIAIGYETYNKEKRMMEHKPYINLTREQALLLGQFLMLASHCEEPE